MPKTNEFFILEKPFCTKPLHEVYKQLGPNLTCRVRQDGARIIHVVRTDIAAAQALKIFENADVYSVASRPDEFPADPFFPTILPRLTSE